MINKNTLYKGILLLGFATNSTMAMELDEACVVNIMNRTVQVSESGSWAMPNVPSFMGRVRARATCLRDGETTSGQSEFFTVVNNGVVNVENIFFDDPTPIPVRLDINGDQVIALTSDDNTAQLNVVATYSDGSSDSDLDFASGVNFQSSNANIASVSPEGLVQAVNSGSALITLRLEGVIALQQVTVAISGDMDGDGLPDDFEIANGLDPNDAVDAFEDQDRDGLSALEEFNAGTDLNNSDTDGDGISDSEELFSGADGVITNPLLADSDGDGVSDSLEISAGSDPNDANSVDLSSILDSISIGSPDIILTYNTLNNEVSRQLLVTGTLIDGSQLDLTNQSTGTTYTSSDLTILSFGLTDGEIFGGAAGVASLTVANSGFTVEAFVTVVNFAPRPVGYLQLPTGVKNVDAIDGYAFVANASSGLIVVDTRNPERPEEVARLDTTGSANDVKVDAGYAYVADGVGGLLIFDVTNPTAPSLVANVAMSNALDVTILNGYAYVARGSAGIEVVDVSAPLTPVKVTTVSGINALAVSASGNRLVGVSAGNLYVYNLQDPASPSLLGSVQTSSTDRNRQVEVQGDFAYVAAYTTGLKVVDISDPANQTGGAQVDDFYPNDVALNGDHAFFGDTLFTSATPYVNIADSSSPIYQGFVDFSRYGDYDGRGIDADDTHFYMVATKGSASRLYIGQHSIFEDNAGIAPTVTIEKPTSVTTAYTGVANDFVVDAIDDVAVASVKFLMNGEALGVRSTNPYRLAFVPPAEATEVELTAIAFDTAGNQSAPVSITVSVEELVVGAGQLLLTVESIHVPNDLPKLTQLVNYADIATQQDAADAAASLALAGWALNGSVQTFDEPDWTGRAPYLRIIGADGDVLGYNLSSAAIATDSERDILFHTDQTVARGSHDICESANNFGIISGLNDEGLRDCVVPEWGHYYLEDVSGNPPEILLVTPLPDTILQGGQEYLFEVTASDDVGVATVYMLVDGVIVDEVYEAPYLLSYVPPFNVGPIVNIDFVAVDFGDRTAAVGLTTYSARADSDEDGLSDEDELAIHNSDPNNADTDGDGLSDGVEVNTHGTDPLLVDTDADGYSDFDELLAGQDPLSDQDNVVDLTAGLLAHLPFEETSYDVTGNGYNGEEFGFIGYEQGVLGYAADLSTEADYIGIAKDIALDDFTISVHTYIKLNATSLGGTFPGNHVFSGFRGTSGNELNLTLNQGNGVDSAITNISDSGYSLVDNPQNYVDVLSSWHHILLRRKAGRVLFYMDGALVGEVDQTVADSLLLEYTTIGTDQDCNGGCIDANQAIYGLVDEFRIYNRAINLSEVAELAKPVTQYADSDLDGVSDLSEVELYGTNPNFADSDADGVNDRDEIKAESNPIGTVADTSDIAAGLIAHLDFETSSADVTGNGYDGVEVGTVRYGNGAVGRSAYLETALDFVGIEQNLSLADFSISTYVNFERLAVSVSTEPDPINVILSGANSLSFNEALWYSGAGNTQDRVYINDERKILNRQAPVSGQWAHYVLMRKGESVFEYVNGALVGKTKVLPSEALDIDYLAIGSDQDALRGGYEAHQGLFGFIDELRIYDRAINLLEIAELGQPVADYLDTDEDGVSNDNEINIYGSDPNVVDTDGDGLTDGDEVNRHGSDPTLFDTDGDGLSDSDEVNFYGTDPTLTDTDGNGTLDADEPGVVALPINATRIENQTIDISGNLNPQGLGVIASTVNAPNSDIVVDGNMVVLGGTSSINFKSLTVNGDLSIYDSTLTSLLEGSLVVNGNVYIVQDSILTVPKSNSSLKNLNPLKIDATGAVTIDASSTIDMSGRGYAHTKWSGPDYAGTTRTGCHGGWVGGKTTDCSYGRHEYARFAGSAGNYFDAIQDGHGGGIVEIKANLLTLEGSINASGNYGYIAGSGSGNSGAGGSIHLDVDQLIGAGTLRAVGGSSHEAAGGGGRVSVYVGDRAGFTGSMTTHTGTGTGTKAGAGTIYVKEDAQAYGHLIADNASQATTSGSTLIRNVGRRAITAVVELSPGTWVVSVSGTPWRATNQALGWGIDGIDVDLDASEDVSAHYVIAENTTNTITINTTDDLSTVVGNELVGVHTFETIKITRGAQVDFGSDRIIVLDAANSLVESGARIEAGQFDQTLVELALKDAGILEAKEPLVLSGLSLANVGNGLLVAPSITVNGNVTIDGSVLSIQSEVGLIVDGNVDLINSTTLRVPKSTASLKNLNPLKIDATGTVTIDSTSTIDMSGRGYAHTKWSGPDYAGTSRSGCHGGWVGGGTTDCSYGRYEHARFAGSAGNYFDAIQDGHGGGIVEVKAALLILEGSIRANGNYGYIAGSGSGNSSAGGSIHIDVDQLVGTGAMNAVGGASHEKAGGGGRISVHVGDRTGFTGSMNTRTGTGTGTKAAAGTIYVKEDAQAHGHLVVDNAGHAAISGSTPIRSVGRRVITGSVESSAGVWEVSVSGTPWRATNATLGWGIDGIDVDLDASEEVSTHYVIAGNTTNSITINTTDDLSTVVGNELVGVHTFETIKISSGAQVDFGSDRIIVLDAANSFVESGARLEAGQFDQALVELALKDTGILEAKDPLVLPSLSLSNVDNGLLVAPLITVNGDVTIDGSVIQIQSDGGLVVDGNVDLINGTTLRVPKSNSSLKNINPLKINATGTVTIDSTSTIDMSGRGYAHTKWSGPDYAGTSRSGCHGGWVGGGTADCSYGRYEHARFAGSAGNYFDGTQDGHGGGIVEVKAAMLNLAGSISANGNYGYIAGSGSGNSSAGGSIHIDVDQLVGAGAISAVGGASHEKAGGGGRLSIYVGDRSGFTGAMNARGGLGTGTKAGAGTVYVKEDSQAYGHLVVDNGGSSSPTNSTVVRNVGKRAITAAVETSPGVWTVTVSGAPWKATDTALDWGVDGIYVRLNADDSDSPLYLISQNSTNTITVNTTDDLSGLVGNELVGVHTFESITESNGASLSFGGDTVIDLSGVTTISLGLDVKLFDYSPDGTEQDHGPMFNFAELVLNAIRYQQEDAPTSGENAVLKMALFKVERDLYFGDDSGELSYGKIRSYDFDGSDSNRFAWLLRKAKENGVEIQFAFHEATDNTGSDKTAMAQNMSAYLTSYCRGAGYDLFAEPADYNQTQVDYEGVCDGQYYAQYLASPLSQIDSIPRFKAIDWGFEASTQMHNKFVTVSHSKDKNGVVNNNSTYVTTTNLDTFEASGSSEAQPKTNYSQSGIQVSQNAGLFNAYNNYFDIIWENADSYPSFTAAMASAHTDSANPRYPLNFDGNNPAYQAPSDPDELDITAYFFPIPSAGETNNGVQNQDPVDGWSATLNPLVAVADRLQEADDLRAIDDTGLVYAKLNSFTVRSSDCLHDDFANRFNGVLDGLQQRHIKLVFNRASPYSVTNGACSTESADYLPEQNPTLGNVNLDGTISGTGRGDYDGANRGTLTHEKTYLFSVSNSDIPNEYYVLTGSANFKSSAFTSKANNLLMVKESAESSSNTNIYNSYKNIFNEAFAR